MSSKSLTVVEEVMAEDGQTDPSKRMQYLYGIDKDGNPKQPTTWDDAARRCVYAIFDHSFKTWDRVSEMREYLDYLIDEMGPESTKGLSEKVCAEYWNLFGSVAAAAGQKKEIFSNISDNLVEHVDSLTDILVKKQSDYGHQNIARFGRAGLLVRVHDKVARLENLLRDDRKPENESILDNFIDVIGYSAIGMMWEKGWFLLNLAAHAGSEDQVKES